MAGQASRENGKKGGRPKGASGVLIEEARRMMIEQYRENAQPINNALVKKAIKGDVPAIKEIHDRVFGKAVQTIAGDKENPISLFLVSFKEAFQNAEKENAGEDTDNPT